jgi:hypothetical protein
MITLVWYCTPLGGRSGLKTNKKWHPKSLIAKGFHQISPLLADFWIKIS